MAVDDSNHQRRNLRRNVFYTSYVGVSVLVLLFGLDTIYTGTENAATESLRRNHQRRRLDLQVGEIDTGDKIQEQEEPSAAPTMGSTMEPSMEPSTMEPSTGPSTSPSTLEPTIPEASMAPSPLPTMPPSVAPSMGPSMEPSMGPSVVPSMAPTGDVEEARCQQVIHVFARRDQWMTDEEREEKHKFQAVDYDSFFRASGDLFWHDFVQQDIGNKLLPPELLNSTELQSKQLEAKSLWTWVVGDLHLFNLETFDDLDFNIVLGPGTYDEAAIYDFQIDIIRFAVSAIYYGKQMGWDDGVMETAVKKFANQYLDNVINYVGNEDANLFQLKRETATGVLGAFLEVILEEKGMDAHFDEFTELEGEMRSFLKGEQGDPHASSRLTTIPESKEEEIKNAFTAMHYGASLTKVGWKINGWNESDSSILDVAARFDDTDIPSLGLERYYIFLNASFDGDPVILDLKEQPEPAVNFALSEEDLAWYKTLFTNSAEQVVQGQRQTTAYTDKYLGWILLSDGAGGVKPFSVRRHSPWRESPKFLGDLTTKEVVLVMQSMAKMISTIHTRGSVAKQPGDFKHVIEALFTDPRKKGEWARGVLDLASSMYIQSVTDFECFQDYIYRHRRIEDIDESNSSLLSEEDALDVDEDLDSSSDEVNSIDISDAEAVLESSVDESLSDEDDVSVTTEDWAGDENDEDVTGEEETSSINEDGDSDMDEEEEDTGLGLSSSGPTSYPTAGPTSGPTVTPPLGLANIGERCDFVVSKFEERDSWMTAGKRKERYTVQVEDFTSYLRSSNHVFLQDFLGEEIGGKLLASVSEDAMLPGSSPVSPKSTWTWISGDQHLENFGAYKNRHGDVVFGMNDFDEAVIFDFQYDLLRIMVSALTRSEHYDVCKEEIDYALSEFTKTYITSILGYVGNEDALLFELTKETSEGEIYYHLVDVIDDEGVEKQRRKFTTAEWEIEEVRFKKGTMEKPHDSSSLAAVSDALEQEIRDAFTALGYGATMLHMGWNVPSWRVEGHFYEVLDVAARLESGTASYGVDRYYVLLHEMGTEELIILDVKQQPEPYMTQVFSEDDNAWYDATFPNTAARVIAAERRLTSYTDPFTGWILLSDSQGKMQPFTVRRRSPWKKKPKFLNSDNLDDEEVAEILTCVAKATAASHVRGTAAKSPGDFKTVINAIFGGPDSKAKIASWGEGMLEMAYSFADQMALDYPCFQDYVAQNYHV